MAVKPTNEEVLAMPAGPDMDALVAEEVMGWFLIAKEEVSKDEKWPAMWLDTDNVFHHNDTTWHPTTEILDAWEVVIEMNRQNLWTYMGVTSSKCYAQIGLPPSMIRVEVGINEMPLAICRAAILAKRMKVEFL